MNVKTKGTVSLIIGALAICIAPCLLTRHALFNLPFFDFTKTGQIGDTIGGITAPIVGLISIILLWKTLKSQQDFNTAQDEINEEQQKFNDANRLMSMEAHILHLDENMTFSFTGLERVLSGKGVASLYLLEKNGTNNQIVRAELEHIITRVYVIDSAVCSMVDFLNQSKISKEEKTASICLAEMYLSSITSFYKNVECHMIDWISSMNDLHGESVGLPNPVEEMMKKAKSYRERTDTYLNTCRNILAL